MKTSLLLLPMTALILSAAPGCKSDKKEECATLEWKLRDSVLTVREHDIAQREKALALYAAGNDLAEARLTIGAGNPSSTANASGNMTARRRADRTRNNRPKANGRYFAKDAGNYPEASARLLTEKDIAFLSTWGHTIMLNEIYARHGLNFKDEKLKAHFDNQDWYRSGRKNVDKSLSTIERQNIEFLKTHKK